MDCLVRKYESPLDVKPCTQSFGVVVKVKSGTQVVTRLPTMCIQSRVSNH